MRGLNKMEDVKKLIDEIGNKFEEYKAENDKA